MTSRHRQSGFDCAVSARFGVNTPETSLYELRRGGPWEHDIAVFALKLAWYGMVDGRRAARAATPKRF